jgi:exopolyphosphatase/guanosine-5'-triphosphate,3'-diphosphate pyrophosphatase
MAQHTAVIDIGSNSMRMAVFQKTSRFAFHIIHEVKSSVRLGESAYKNGGFLQNDPMDRASQALGEFLLVARSFKVRKVLCVATSALRDAPNKSDFIQRIQREHSLSIKVIDGNKEAYLGGIACANLLPKMDAVTVDVGGGSTEFALLDNGNITQTISLNIGTVRLKELFMDNNDMKGAISYIDDALSALPFESSDVLIGIGGTFRAITHAIIKKEDYPLRKIHGFLTKDETFENLCMAILDATPKKLKSLNIKPDRFDTIKTGALIFLRILKRLQSKTLVCSGAGIREGVFLSDLLRNCGHKFPANYNVSVRCLLDTHANHSNHGVECSSLVKKIFDLTYKHLELDLSWRTQLVIAAKLLPIGLGIHYYAYQKHSHYLAMSGLNYGLTHKHVALISHLLLFKKGSSLCDLIPKNSYETLLPDTKTLNTLHALLWLSHILLASRAGIGSFNLSFSDNELTVQSPHLYLAREQLKNIVLPKNLTLTLL